MDRAVWYMKAGLDLYDKSIHEKDAFHIKTSATQGAQKFLFTNAQQ